MTFALVISFYILYRLYELSVARSNEHSLGFPKEVGRKQRMLMVILHSTWFLSMLVEYYQLKPSGQNAPFIVIPILLFCIWVRSHSMKELGLYWNTKIFKLENQPIVKTGLYKYFKHPNYLIVILEIFLIPYFFELYITAIAYSLLNMFLLYFRIQLESEVLYE